MVMALSRDSRGANGLVDLRCISLVALLRMCNSTGQRQDACASQYGIDTKVMGHGAVISDFARLRVVKAFNQVKGVKAVATEQVA